MGLRNSLQKGNYIEKIKFYEKVDKEATCSLKYDEIKQQKEKVLSIIDEYEIYKIKDLFLKILTKYDCNSMQDFISLFILFKNNEISQINKDIVYKNTPIHISLGESTKESGLVIYINEDFISNLNVTKRGSFFRTIDTLSDEDILKLYDILDSISIDTNLLINNASNLSDANLEFDYDLSDTNKIDFSKTSDYNYDFRYYFHNNLNISETYPQLVQEYNFTLQETRKIIKEQKKYFESRNNQILNQDILDKIEGNKSYIDLLNFLFGLSDLEKIEIDNYFLLSDSSGIIGLSKNLNKDLESLISDLSKLFGDKTSKIISSFKNILSDKQKKNKSLELINGIKFKKR